MKKLAKLIAVLMLGHLGLPAADAPARGQEQDTGQERGQDDRLSLADLAGYRAALSGNATADDALSSDRPVRVGFRDLWDRPDSLRGRRVTVQGQVARVFRQGPVGSFPPLAEVWITSPAGDPFCLVFPLDRPSPGDGQKTGTAFASVAGDRPNAGTPEPAGPDLGRTVRFTGTFLKMIRYAASDGDRLAPLVAGDRPPMAASIEANSKTDWTPPPSTTAAILRAMGGGSAPGTAVAWQTWSPVSWALGLALAALAAGLLARQHLPRAVRAGPPMARIRQTGETDSDPPLQFLDPTNETSV
jgi:hypothetical protein